MEALRVGQYVKYAHPLSFMPELAGKYEYGVVNSIEDGMVFVTSPIGKDDPREHSQSAPYKTEELQVVTQEEALKNLPKVWASVDPNELVESEGD